MLKTRYAIRYVKNQVCYTAGMLKILMSPNVKILMGQSFGSWTQRHGSMALGSWALALAAAGVCVVPAGRGGGGQGQAMGPYPLSRRRPRTRARAHGPRAMGPGPCVQEPKLWPMSILTFGPVCIFSIPDFQHT